MEFDDAAKQFWILDKDGLITRKRPDEELTDVTRPFAAIGEDDQEGESLLDVVKRVRHMILCVHDMHGVSADDILQHAWCKYFVTACYHVCAVLVKSWPMTLRVSSHSMLSYVHLMRASSGSLTCSLM